MPVIESKRVGFSILATLAITAILAIFLVRVNSRLKGFLIFPKNPLCSSVPSVVKVLDLLFIYFAFLRASVSPW